MTDVKTLYFADTRNGFKIKSKKVLDWDNKKYMTEWGFIYKSEIGNDFFLTPHACAEHALAEATKREIAAHREAEAIEAWMEKNGGKDGENQY